MNSDRTEMDLVATAPEDAIVVFDCTFLQRGLLRDQWDEVIYLQVRARTMTRPHRAMDERPSSDVATARTSSAESH
jgi:hypothetical protein